MAHDDSETIAIKTVSDIEKAVKNIYMETQQKPQQQVKIKTLNVKKQLKLSKQLEVEQEHEFDNEIEF